MQQVEYQTVASEFVDAFRTTKAAKNVFWWLILLALVTQIAVFCLVQFAGFIDPLHAIAPPAEAAATAPATQATTQPSEEVVLGNARMWQEIFLWLLSATRFMAFVACLLLALTLTFTVKINLLDRMGGVAGFVAAFFWSIVLLAMLTPWQKILGGMACGATFSYGELLEWAALVKGNWGGSEPLLGDRIFYYVRFLAYPLVALLVLIVAQVRFSRGYQLTALTQAEQPIPEVPAAEEQTYTDYGEET